MKGIANIAFTIFFFFAVSYEIRQESSLFSQCFATFGEGNGSPLQYSYLENAMYGGAGKAAVHGVAELDTTEWLSLTQSLATFKVVSVYVYI